MYSKRSGTGIQYNFGMHVFSHVILGAAFPIADCFAATGGGHSVRLPGSGREKLPRVGWSCLSPSFCTATLP